MECRMQPGELLPPRLAVAFLWAAGPGTGISVTCRREPGGHEGGQVASQELQQFFVPFANRSWKTSLWKGSREK